MLAPARPRSQPRSTGAQSIVKEATEFIQAPSRTSGGHGLHGGKLGALTARGRVPEPKAESLTPLPGLVKIYFEDPKKHGLRWQGNLVVAVSQLAGKLGVRAGWRIHMIDGKSVANSEDIWRHFQDAQWQWRSCWVWFFKDPASIRDDEAKEKEEREEAARRPFKSTKDERLMGLLRVQWPFQGYIPQPEDRGITLLQLKHVVEWTEAHCHRWFDTAPPEHSKTAGQILHRGIMNLYHVNEWLIRPSTEAKDCSFVEMMTDEAQPPTWFISHWWGERVNDFLRCVSKHAMSRGVAACASYWVCAYAIRQHSLQNEIGGDPKNSSFFKALQVAAFRVLLILNEPRPGLGPAVPFTRVWCTYEEAMCLDARNHTLDVACCNGGKPELLTPGLTMPEQVMEERDPGTGLTEKDSREGTFPVYIVEAGLGFQIQRAQASVEVDRTRILNSVAGRDLDLPPLEEDDAFDLVNRRVRSVFALAFWRRSMAETASEELKRLRVKMAAALAMDTTRAHLDLSLAGCERCGDEELALLTQSLPQSLQELNLDLKGLTITDAGVGALASRMARAMQAGDLDLADCAHVTDAGVKALREHLPKDLKSLRLNLKGTKCSQAVQEQCGNLKGLLDCSALSEPPPSPAASPAPGSAKSKKKGGGKSKKK